MYHSNSRTEISVRNKQHHAVRMANAPEMRVEEFVDSHVFEPNSRDYKNLSNRPRTSAELEVRICHDTKDPFDQKQLISRDQHRHLGNYLERERHTPHTRKMAEFASHQGAGCGLGNPEFMKGHRESKKNENGLAEAGSNKGAHTFERTWQDCRGNLIVSLNPAEQGEKSGYNHGPMSTRKADEQRRLCVRRSTP